MLGECVRPDITVIDVKGDRQNRHLMYCEKILRTVSPDAVIKNIELHGDDVGRCSVHELVRGLNIAYEYHPYIVSLSMGSTIREDWPMILKVVKKLRKRNICIVAALSNRRKFTAPASFQGVIGVCTDSIFPYDSPKICSVKENILGVDLFVTDLNHRYQENILDHYNMDGDSTYLAGNSFATPYVAAKLLNLTKKGNNFCDIRESFAKISISEFIK